MSNWREAIGTFSEGDRVSLRLHQTGTVVSVDGGMVTVRRDGGTWVGPADPKDLYPGDHWIELEDGTLVESLDDTLRPTEFAKFVDDRGIWRVEKVKPTGKRPMSEFKPGDAVRHKSGGWKMVVGRCAENGELVCQWWVEIVGQYNRGHFMPGELVAVEEGR